MEAACAKAPWGGDEPGEWGGGTSRSVLQEQNEQREEEGDV